MTMLLSRFVTKHFIGALLTAAVLMTFVSHSALAQYKPGTGSGGTIVPRLPNLVWDSTRCCDSAGMLRLVVRNTGNAPSPAGTANIKITCGGSPVQIMIVTVPAIAIGQSVTLKPIPCCNPRIAAQSRKKCPCTGPKTITVTMNGKTKMWYCRS